MTPWRKVLAELLGTAGLLCAVLGSGIMTERLAGGNVALALLANTLATVFALYVLIEVFGQLSGAHFNPAVTVVMAARGAMPRSLTVAYVVGQLNGTLLGAWLAHAMFDTTILQFPRRFAAAWVSGLPRPSLLLDCCW